MTDALEDLVKLHFTGLVKVLLVFMHDQTDKRSYGWSHLVLKFKGELWWLVIRGILNGFQKHFLEDPLLWMIF